MSSSTLKSTLFTSADMASLPEAKPSLSTTVFIDISASVELSKINQALSTLPNPPLSELESANLPGRSHLYRLEIPRESYLPLQTILHHQFGTKIKFYTSRDAEMFFEGTMNQLFLENIHEAFNEEDLKLLFNALGTVKSIEIKEVIIDQSNTINNNRNHNVNKTSRYAFVTFEKEEDAKKALLKINNLSLGNGVKLHIGLWNEKLSQHLKEYLDTYQTLSFDEQKKHYQKMTKNYNTQQTRRNTKPTQNVILAHMFDPMREQGNSNWEQEILSAISTEVAKYGTLEDSFLIPDAKGRVYLRLNNIETAEKVVQNMNRKWFGEFQIVARFQDDLDFYNMKSMK